jgi:hypothetical protein
MSGRSAALGFALLAGAVALPLSPARSAAPAHPKSSAPPPASATRALDDTARVRRWREDLRFVVDKVTSVHPRPFAFSSRAAFDSASAAIEKRIPATDDAGLAIEFMRMIASLGDGHTLFIGTLPPLGFDTVLPIWLRPFEDGLYVGAAGPEAAGAVGARVVSLGGVPADSALERVLTITSGDNRYTRLDRAPLFLMMPTALRAVGIGVEGNRVAVEIERPGGKRERLTVASGPPPEGFPFSFLESDLQLPKGWTFGRRQPADGPPRWDRRPGDAWWFEYLREYRVLYLRMRRVDAVSGPLVYFEFYRRLFAAVDSLKPRALAIDLRQNHGGNNTILDPLVRGIVERPWLDREGALFALVDRATFSAAMNAAVFLEDQTRVTFVGEPTGGRVNHYGDGREFHTPNLKMMLQVSTLPWASRFPSDERAWIAPDLAVRSTFAEWSDGRDRGLEAVIDAVLRGSLGTLMLTAARDGGPAAAIAAREKWRQRYPNPWSEGLERRLLPFAAELMDRGAPSDAAALAEALVQVEPGSYLAWRTLGEAKAAIGDRDRAVESLRRALQVNPRGQVARVMLERLGEKP